jgi:predicted RNA-binding protein associated with RNAse of E/G family
MATWTQADIDELKKAVSSGILTVKYADRTVTYQSLADMRALLADMQRDVAAAAGSNSFTLAATRKGV